ncbi:hypothetical protein ACFVHW_01470, partial [Streptomyces sp. NPDC127110]|uniref:hypothetical protein n=1 Tax=Streptomyces sp. NPDC127110 TaxID=3345362 RepID=UPI00363E470D
MSAQLEGALTACASGAAGVVLLEGAVGCGKTEMLLHVAERAEGGGGERGPARRAPPRRDRTPRGQRQRIRRRAA